jgi:outer membrane beta-barrel protein
VLLGTIAVLVVGGLGLRAAVWALDWKDALTLYSRDIRRSEDAFDLQLNLAAEQVLHFDLSLMAGPDLIFHDEVLSRVDAEALAAAGGTPSTTSAIGGHVGIGVRIYLNRFMALRFDVKDYIYSVKVPNWVEGSGNQPRNDLQNQLFLELGLSFFFPTSPRVAGGGT